MTVDTKNVKYVPGMYAKKRPNASDLANQYILEWEQNRMALIRKKEKEARISDCISFSREIGVGALEIVDILAEKRGFTVVDREILNYIAETGQLQKSTIEFFDERYPGKMSEFASLLFGEKSFVMSDYMRALAGAVHALADAGPTLFVGRGTHWMLPREHVLAVRFISSKAFRVRRIAEIMGIPEDIAEKTLEDEDKRQNSFFKKNFGSASADSHEFDLVINCSYTKGPEAVAELVDLAYRQKFE